MNRHTSPVIGSFDQKTGSLLSRLDRRQLLKFAATVPVMPIIAGCSTLTRGDPAPASVADQVTVLGIPNGRFWSDTQVEAMAREAIEAQERERAALGVTGRLPPYRLAVSGGGDNGAFGAGLLWAGTNSGTIPTFKLVTGVSTGSMIAPFAFLGGSYYNRLRTIYTTITPSDILQKRGLYSAIFGDALADTTPLFHLISRFLDEGGLVIADGPAWTTSILSVVIEQTPAARGSCVLDQGRRLHWHPYSDMWGLVE